MKIIQVTPYYPPHLGGMENVVLGIKNELDQLKISNLVITSNIPPKKQKGVKRIFAKQFFHVPWAPTLIFYLWNSIRKGDIVHIHQSTVYFPELAFLVAKLKKAKVIINNHGGLEPSGFFGFLLPLYDKTINGFILNNADLVITQSLEYNHILHKKYNLCMDKCFIFTNGIDPIFINGAREKIHYANNLKLLFVGRLSKQKNIFLLLKTMVLLKEEGVNLTIVGDGELRSEVILFLQKNNLNNVEYLGRKSKEELVVLYSQHDVLILTSNYEGLPLVILEAMASGLPIVCTNIPGVKSFLDKGGILTSFNSKDIAQSCILLKKDSNLYKRLSKEAYKKGKGYIWSVLVQKSLIPIYKSLNLRFTQKAEKIPNGGSHYENRK